MNRGVRMINVIKKHRQEIIILGLILIISLVLIFIFKDTPEKTYSRGIYVAHF